MVEELLGIIRAAEADADKIKADAQHEAREVVKAAEEACLFEERRMNAELRARHQQVLEQKRAAVEQEIQNDAGLRQKELDALSNRAKARMQAAADLIFERVVADGHH